MGLREAIEEAGRRRIRPILMTTLTTVLGLLPLALALGEGGEAQAPLARAVIGGLLSATLITLVFVPVVYSVFERGPAPERRRVPPPFDNPGSLPGSPLPTARTPLASVSGWNTYSSPAAPRSPESDRAEAEDHGQ
jgi:hypothetical protein